jgi:multidrug efflux pump subunit AcrB
MTLSDISIKNPVFAWMLMFGLIFFGFISFRKMGLSQMPDVDFPVVNISVNLNGAAPEIMETNVVDIIEESVMSVEGIVSLTSTSKYGSANITVEFDLHRDVDAALQDIQTKVIQAQKLLPKELDPLKILLSQIASSMFFFVPTIKDFQKHYILTKEINADQLVINTNGTKHLKFALVKLLRNPIVSVSGVASFASSADLEQRIKILAGVATKNKLNLSQIRLLLSFIVLGAALFLLYLPVYAVEDGMNDHELFMCPFGGECVVACQTQGISNDLFFSSKDNFSPLEISSHAPNVNQSVNPLP